ncbi:MAG TPA: beta-galactosidase, partial [Anaerolineae bacterium]|nr:beta-galactosidase [Anaerolineae bacterium]
MRQKGVAGHAVRGLVLLAILVIAGAIPKPIIIMGSPRAVETVNPKMGAHTRLTDEVEEWKIQRTLQLVREMGAPWVVEYFPWGYIEPAKGQFDWQHADMVVDHAVNQGLTVMARLDFVPEWARPKDTTFRYLDEEHYQDYGD